MPRGVYVRTHRPPIAEQFWAKVQKSDGCWEWTGLLNEGGYGRFALSPTWQRMAHRFSWELAHGPIPAGMHACHHCDNRKCVRPDHLFLGTRHDNMHDASEKGRLPNQHKTHCAKGHPLTGDNVRERYDHPGRLCVACARAGQRRTNRARRARGLR